MIRRRKLLTFGSIILVGVFLAVWAFVVEPNRLVVNEVQVPMPTVDQKFGHIRIALLADIHAGSPWISVGKIKQIVAKTNAAKPDMILLLGDYVVNGVMGGHAIEPEVTCAELRNLSAPLGTFAVLGNHDWSFDGKRVTAALSNAGIVVLENQAVPIEREGRRFWLAGVADKWSRTPDFGRALSQVTDDQPVIAFTHNPDVFVRSPARVSILFAGHTHGGQVNLPILGRLIVPSDFGERFAIGHVVEDGRHLYVSPGIGTSIVPVRFRVPPEITIVDL